MRAGSLSDPRIVAMLSKYFVCVHMTELSAKHLIPDPRDVALLERYHEKSGGKFFGGEREAFLTPKGELVDVFLSLHLGASQMTPAGRANVNAAVSRFFRSAAKSMRLTHGKLPGDWTALETGLAPEVAAARSNRPAERFSARDELRLRMAMRHDWLMYEDLSGWEDIVFTRDEARSLVPQAKRGATRAWPRKLLVRLLRTLHPRGGGVAIDLDDASVHGSLWANVNHVTQSTVTGVWTGAFRLAPTTKEERSTRDTYRPYLQSGGRLHGDFVWDRKVGRFTRLRLIGVDATVRSNWKEHGRQGVFDCRIGIEALPYR